MTTDSSPSFRHSYQYRPIFFSIFLGLSDRKFFCVYSTSFPPDPMFFISLFLVVVRIHTLRSPSDLIICTLYSTGNVSQAAVALRLLFRNLFSFHANSFCRCTPFVFSRDAVGKRNIWVGRVSDVGTRPRTRQVTRTYPIQSPAASLVDLFQLCSHPMITFFHLFKTGFLRKTRS
ncbi:hypothetical protein PM082_017539 [Marasmius tenuissimus]|nr:hypothetical protein PM082_017539 [Marasmius tenuissimus]